MDIDRAKAISDVAQTIINSAKVEIQFIEATQCDPSGDFYDTLEYERRIRGEKKPLLPGRGGNSE
jgi:hypothetical protein